MRKKRGLAVCRSPCHVRLNQDGVSTRICKLSPNALYQRRCRTRLLVRQSNEIHQTHADAVRVDRACDTSEERIVRCTSTSATWEASLGPRPKPTLHWIEGLGTRLVGGKNLPDTCTQKPAQYQHKEGAAAEAKETYNDYLVQCLEFS